MLKIPNILFYAQNQNILCINTSKCIRLERVGALDDVRLHQERVLKRGAQRVVDQLKNILDIGGKAALKPLCFALDFLH